MRVLVLTSPGLGHVFPTVPLSWALRSAGHEVLYAATGPGDGASGAGLPVIDVAPGVDIRGVFMNAAKEMPAVVNSDILRQLSSDDALRMVSELFSRVSAPAADGAVELARNWRPDLVVHSSLQACGPLVGGVLGIPVVEHSIGLGLDPRVQTALAEGLGEHYAKYDARPAERVARINLAPDSLFRGAHAVAKPVADWLLRCVPYNGKADLPGWLLKPVERTRVAVTLGTVSPQTGGVDGLRHVVDAAAEVDAEFVLALGDDVDTTALGTLPSNVRAEGWIPLNALLATSAALIHHGGAGTTLTALAAGVPQLVMPDGADRFRNAELVRDRGAGLEVAAADVKPDTLTTLLGDPDLATAATEVRDEIAALPSPADLVTPITEFVAG